MTERTNAQSLATNTPQGLAADHLVFIIKRNSHLAGQAMGGYFFFVIATTIATIVEVKTASNVRAANTIVKTSLVVISFTPFTKGVSAATRYVVARISLSQISF